MMVGGCQCAASQEGGGHLQLGHKKTILCSFVLGRDALPFVFVLLCTNPHIMRCYMQVWANNGNDNKSPSRFSESQLECCQLKRDVIRGS